MFLFGALLLPISIAVREPSSNNLPNEELVWIDTKPSIDNLLPNKFPLALILPTTSKAPVIAELPFLCPVDKNVCEADIKFCPCQEPEMSAAIWVELLKNVYVFKSEPVAASIAPEILRAEGAWA